MKTLWLKTEGAKPLRILQNLCIKTYVLQVVFWTRGEHKDSESSNPNPPRPNDCWFGTRPGPDGPPANAGGQRALPGRTAGRRRRPADKTEKFPAAGGRRPNTSQVSVVGTVGALGKRGVSETYVAVDKGGAIHNEHKEDRGQVEEVEELAADDLVQDGRGDVVQVRLDGG